MVGIKDVMISSIWGTGRCLCLIVSNHGCPHPTHSASLNNILLLAVLFSSHPPQDNPLLSHLFFSTTTHSYRVYTAFQKVERDSIDT